MNELHKAYHALGMEPGAQFEIVKRRYRRLALVWHPDRMTNAEAKQEMQPQQVICFVKLRVNRADVAMSPVRPCRQCGHVASAALAMTQHREIAIDPQSV